MTKSQFELMAKKEKEIVCDICGSIMLPLYGGGWDNDRMACTNRECGAEIVFPTSTLFEEEENQ